MAMRVSRSTEHRKHVGGACFSALPIRRSLGGTLLADLGRSRVYAGERKRKRPQLGPVNQWIGEWRESNSPIFSYDGGRNIPA